jgi:hypothetical protein
MPALVFFIGYDDVQFVSPQCGVTPSGRRAFLRVSPTTPIDQPSYVTMAALLPIAPILLLPFIVVFFIIVFPLWLVATAVLGALLGIARGIDALLRALHVGVTISKPVSDAFHWTLSWGGIANRRDRPSGD